jgi:hypothetical protein
MIRRLFAAFALCLLAFSAQALTTQQLQTLKAAILAETDPAFVSLRQAGATGAMADFYNGNSAFVVWKSSVTIRETGQAFNGAEWAGMTSANHTRLQTVAQYLMSYSPATQGIRDMFNDIWSGAGGTNTRAALLALWKRFATKGERLFATGTGSDAVPGLLVFEGSLRDADIVGAINLP